MGDVGERIPIVAIEGTSWEGIVQMVGSRHCFGGHDGSATVVAWGFEGCQSTFG